MDQERIDQISRTLAAGIARRRVLRALGVVGTSGLLAVMGQAAIAGERPHQRLQDRSKQRNHKQRNDKNKKNNNSNSNNDGGQLGSGQTCEAQCQEQFEGCMEPCAGSPSSLDFCTTRCDEQQSECEDRCQPA